MATITSDIVVIGGGIAGLAVATELAIRKAGSITLLEKSYIGSGNATRNVGRVRATQLTEHLTKLALKCQEKYNGIGEDLGFNVLFRRGGYAFLLYDDDEFDFMRKVSAMHNQVGVKSEILNPSDVLRLLPVLKSGEPVKGALFHSRDGVVHHDAVVWAYYQKALALGCRVHQGREVTRIFTEGHRIKGVETSQDSIDTPLIINAAGPSCTDVARLAGINIPTVLLRREAIATMPIKPLMDCACTYYRPIEGVFNQTMRGEIVAMAVNPKEPEGYNRGSSFDFLVRVSSMLVRKAPILGELKIQRSWAGVYAVSPDHLPLIGESKAVKGFYQLNGWSGRGVLLSPYTSELLAEEILSGSKPDLLKPFDPNRFEGSPVEFELEEDYYARYR